MKIENELGELQAKITDWRETLADDRRVLQLVMDELNELREKYGDERRTPFALFRARWTLRISSRWRNVCSP